MLVEMRKDLPEFIRPIWLLILLAAITIALNMSYPYPHPRDCARCVIKGSFRP